MSQPDIQPAISLDSYNDKLGTTDTTVISHKLFMRSSWRVPYGH